MVLPLETHPPVHTAYPLYEILTTLSRGTLYCVVHVLYATLYCIVCTTIPLSIAGRFGLGFDEISWAV